MGYGCTPARLVSDTLITEPHESRSRYRWSDCRPLPTLLFGLPCRRVTVSGTVPVALPRDGCRCVVNVPRCSSHLPQLYSARVNPSSSPAHNLPPNMPDCVRDGISTPKLAQTTHAPREHTVHYVLARSPGLQATRSPVQDGDGDRGGRPRRPGLAGGRSNTPESKISSCAHTWEAPVLPAVYIYLSRCGALSAGRLRLESGSAWSRAAP